MSDKSANKVATRPRGPDQPRTDGDHSSTPLVSVVIAVWNVEPYLRECLDSVVEQSIGLDRLEIIAVDDGSTDASSEILDDYAARFPQLTVIHSETPSGGPGRPRNIGLDRAIGRYVFFLDADDYLGREALARLVAMAERNGSDIVVPRRVTVGNRRASLRLLNRDVDRASVEQVYRSGSALKLFRRELLDRINIRFPEGVPGGEDTPFTSHAYLEAATISILGTYDCYYVRGRPGSQTTRKDRTDDPVEALRRIERERIELVAQYRKPGRARDVLLVRHVIDICRKLGPVWLGRDSDVRQRMFDTAAEIIERWWPERLDPALPPWFAVRAYCLRHGLAIELAEIVAAQGSTYTDVLVEDGHVFARLPHFRSGRRIPDRYFDIATRVAAHQRSVDATLAGDVLEVRGEAWLSTIGGSTAVVLAGWPTGSEYRLETTAQPTPHLRDKVFAYPVAGFTVRIELEHVANGRPLPPGTWNLLLSIGDSALRRTVPVRLPRGTASVGSVRGDDNRRRPARVYRTRSGIARLRIGRRHPAIAVLERVEGRASRIRKAAVGAAAGSALARRILLTTSWARRLHAREEE